jgi:hypothetical protein
MPVHPIPENSLASDSESLHRAPRGVRSRGMSPRP